MRSIRYLIVPGWHGSPDEHWQSHWYRTLPGSARVEQQDWFLPLQLIYCLVILVRMWYQQHH